MEELAEVDDYDAHLEAIKQRLNRVRSPLRSAEYFEIEEIFDPRAIPSAGLPDGYYGYYGYYGDDALIPSRTASKPSLSTVGVEVGLALVPAEEVLAGKYIYAYSMICLDDENLSGNF